MMFNDLIISIRRLSLTSFLKTHRLLLLILLLAASVRLYKIESPLYDWNAWRQTETVAIAMNYYQDHLPFLYPEIDWVGEHGHAEMEFPLFPYLISWLYYLTFPWDGWGRLITVLFSLGVVCAVYDIGKQLSSRTMGLFAAAFFAASPLAVYYGRAFMPDMTMVFFSTLSVALMLRWQPSDPKWLYVAAYSLAVGVLMKPPCLMVSFPILWILHQRFGWRFLISKDVWMAVLIVFVPSAIWYTHAHSFFEESQASFIRHFKDTGFIEYITANVQWQNFQVILIERISQNILAIVGWIPLLLGLIRLSIPHPSRWGLIFWLIGTFIFYAVIAAHHRGHDYYSLLPIVPLSLVCGYGCEWAYNKITYPARIAVWILPASVLVVGFYGLLRFDAYRPWYAFYQDALAMQSKIPEDALILVMDEILHTPEFFYFINRNGWHRFREPGENMDDSEWLERHRSLGADYYFGMNEGPGNHPLHYLQTHPMGQYIQSHYQIEYIGARFFAANLNKPFSEAQTIENQENILITTPAVLQAEQLLIEDARLINDPDADRHTALLTKEKAFDQVMVYGPYFNFPDGIYDFTFRLRLPHSQEFGGVEIALRNGSDYLASKRLRVATGLSETYQDFTLTQTVTSDMPIETRVTAGSLTSVILDTVSIQSRKHLERHETVKQNTVALVLVEDEIMQLTDQGYLLRIDGGLYHQIGDEKDVLSAVGWDNKDGIFWIGDEWPQSNVLHTLVYTTDHFISKQGEWYKVFSYQEDEATVAVSSVSGTLAILSNMHKVYVSAESGQSVHDLPQTTAPPRDIAVTSSGEIYVLYGSGNIITVPGGAVQTSIPVVGTDVYRRLIPHQNGFYVVDALGAIHNTEDIPPVRSPYYKAEDWIADAERSPSGQWAFLTKEGQVLTFEE